MKNMYKQQRIDLAAAFRWTARLSMNEAVANHYSLSVSDDGQEFLVNPNGRHFSRIKASDLLLLDANDSKTMEQKNAPDPTAWAIHGAIHRNHPEARCIMHVHSKYATILSSLEITEIPPIDQNTMRFFKRVSFDTGYDGMGLADEAERLSASLGNNKVLVLGNHGVLVTAQSVFEAFDVLYYFERSCETLIGAYQTGKELRVVSDAIAEKTAQQWQHMSSLSKLHFDELKAILDDSGSNYSS